MHSSCSKWVAAAATLTLALSGAVSTASAEGQMSRNGGGFAGGGVQGGGVQHGGVQGGAVQGGFAGRGFHGGNHGGFAGRNYAGMGGHHRDGFGQGGYRGGFSHRGYSGGGYYGRGDYNPGYDDDYGYGYGGLGLGFTAGLIGGALMATQAPDAGYSGRTESYCESRFKSYDRASGTYLGYDGMRHSCP